ncbi:MAG: uracil-DNA glycosylase, partial [Methanobrevibacter sp.]|nr:uracil-DNA glycosylase [Methanobrevibacter sp.]
HMKDIFKAFQQCSLNNLRVVILGQDPYPQKDVATGIAFANSLDTPEKSYSPSLNILMESVIDFTVPHRRIIFDQSLEKWEAQGVLMLNSARTCELGKPGSHALLWRPFINSFLSNLSMQYTAIVYVLMGSQAQSFEYAIVRNNYVIKAKHPSYYARTKTRMPSDIWKQVNDILININGFGIQWYEES